MIELIDVSKTFQVKNQTIQAVKAVNVTIEPGEIFGFIGYSGAGKSTLVRCINLLERPTTGQVIYDGVELTQLSERDLRQKRKEIGMIFQQFNLLASLTVEQNVAFNLQDSSLSRSQIRNRVKELLQLVGIPDKTSAYPSQLSGGQKQRVAIARALANNPKVLLCDEATSALDPQTTGQILALLKELNQKLGITIVLITHEMHVIKSICDRVAVMENGAIVEINDVYSIFADARTSIAQEFVNSTTNKDEVIRLIQTNREIFGLHREDEVLHLDFKEAKTNDAVISRISRDYHLDCSIVYGDVDVIKERILGQLIVSLKGERTQIEAAKAYLIQQDIVWEVI